MSQNIELVLFYLSYKLSQTNYHLNHTVSSEPSNSTDWRAASLDEEQQIDTQANGTFNGTHPGVPLASTTDFDTVKETLRDTATKLEVRYAHELNNLHSKLHITPATTYENFKDVMDWVFRDGINWGRILRLFVFGGGLCVECVEKEMSPLVGRIIEWMMIYLDIHIQPWIQSQGGWEKFAEIFGQHAAAQSQWSQGSFKKWLLAGMIMVTGIVAGGLIMKKYH